MRPKMSKHNYNEDSKAISRIANDKSLDQKTKNELMSGIEKRMAIEEQKELDGKGSGYYND